MTATKGGRLSKCWFWGVLIFANAYLLAVMVFPKEVIARNFGRNSPEPWIAVLAAPALLFMCCVVMPLGLRSGAAIIGLWEACWLVVALVGRAVISSFYSRTGRAERGG